LGNKFAKFKSSLTIAKIDATNNYFPRNIFGVQGFPTIYFLPANAKKRPIKYEGNRDVADMESFVRSKATKPLGSEREL